MKNSRQSSNKYDKLGKWMFLVLVTLIHPEVVEAALSVQTKTTLNIVIILSITGTIAYLAYMLSSRGSGSKVLGVMLGLGLGSVLFVVSMDIIADDGSIDLDKLTFARTAEDDEELEEESRKARDAEDKAKEAERKAEEEIRKSEEEIRNAKEEKKKSKEAEERAKEEERRTQRVSWILIAIAVLVVILASVFAIITIRKKESLGGIRALINQYILLSRRIIRSKDDIISQEAGKEYIAVEQTYVHAIEEMQSVGMMSLQNIIADPKFKNTTKGRKIIESYLTAFGLTKSTVKLLVWIFSNYRRQHDTDITNFHDRINNLLSFNINTSFNTGEFLRQEKKLLNESVMIKSKLDKNLPRIIKKLKRGTNHERSQAARLESHLPHASTAATELINKIKDVIHECSRARHDINTVADLYSKEKKTYHAFLDILEHINSILTRYEPLDFSRYLGLIPAKISNYDSQFTTCKNAGDYLLLTHHQHYTDSVYGRPIPRPPVSPTRWDALYAVRDQLIITETDIITLFDELTSHHGYADISNHNKRQVLNWLTTWTGYLERTHNYKIDFNIRFRNAQPPA